MKKVFLDDLPRGGKNIGRNGINWVKSVGYRVKFIYKDIKGEVEIIGYNRDKIKKRGFVDVRYKDDVVSLFTGSFTDCCLGKLIKKIGTGNYLHNINEILEVSTGSIKLTKQIYIDNGKESRKGYEYKCLVCGDENTITEAYLKRDCCGCSTCSNKKVSKGINDIATTHPHLVKYFLHIEDTHKYSFGSNVICLMICPDCGFEKETQISDLSTYGYSCPKCGDGISYPNKFVFNVLEQLDIKFNTENTFTWSENKRYDFYIHDSNCVIEANGQQHYTSCFERLGGRSLEDEQINDKLKEKLAKENNIENYITIDCRRSEMNFIKNKVINSKLNELYDLSKIDFMKCHEYACKNLVKIICDLWNNDSTIESMANKFKLARQTITRYLKQGNLVNWCDYKPFSRKPTAIFKKDIYNKTIKNKAIKIKNIIQYKKGIKYKKVICLNNNQTYCSLTKATELSGATNICNCCKNNSIYSGINTNGEYLQWQYYNEFLIEPKQLLTNKQIDVILFKNKQRTKIICLNTMMIFNSITEAGERYNIKWIGNIVSNCRNKRNHTGVDEETGEYLQWQYYNDFLIKPKLVLSNEEIDKCLLEKQKIVGLKNGGKGKKKVICINTREIFNSIREANDFYKLSGIGVSACCNPKNRHKSAGKHSVTGEKLIWMYYDEYLKLQTKTVIQ